MTINCHIYMKKWVFLAKLICLCAHVCVCVQVINIINAAQESSPMPVAEALDRVLGILRTTELYSPQLGTKDEDPHTNSLVG